MIKILMAAVAAAVVATVVMIVVIRDWADQTSRINQVVHDNCVAIEALKVGGREAVQASINADLAYLRDNPDQTPAFYRAVLLANAAAKAHALNLFAPRPCP
jgi:K+ transporter